MIMASLWLYGEKTQLLVLHVRTLVLAVTSQYDKDGTLCDLTIHQYTVYMHADDRQCVD